MSLPPGFLDELRNRLPLSQVVGRKVIWDRRKSNQAKGDFWAPCPFHQEKTASFHVDDRKGFYYCFGCHAKGDALSFVKETENVGFMEAVEILAREAGMAMPARDPKAAEQADRRSALIAVMEEAVKYFRLQLNTQAGALARDYLARRRLGRSALDRFEIGFAPDSRSGLFAALSAKGIGPDLIVEAGLAIRPDEGGPPYDRFRGRIIFPIRDARGRAISLGGRAMDPNARAKYLNGPETPLFDKGRNLYNIGPAREACGRGQRLIVAEGYIDVIALVEAGFTGAVAPLGTAITEDQLRLMWRVSDEPVIALDGDTAGLRAGLRLVDLALPLLEAGKGLRFAILPGGQDPDDLIKSEGREAMERVLTGARPMVDLLWTRETEGQDFSSPERQAALELRMTQLVGRIKDRYIKDRYEQTLRRQLKDLFWSVGRRKGPSKTWGKPIKGTERNLPLATTRSTLLASAGGERVAEQLRETMIVAILCAHPGLVAEFESQIDRLALDDADLCDLRDTMLRHGHDTAETLAAVLANTNGAALDRVMSHPHVRSAPPVLRRDDPEFARMCLAEELAKLQSARAVRTETEEAAEALEGLADEGVTWRISQATKALHHAEKSHLEDSADFGEDRAAMSDFLQSLLDKHSGG